MVRRFFSDELVAVPHVGTEPVVRLHGEAGNDAHLTGLMAVGRKYILG
jgi:hypothetical protein